MRSGSPADAFRGVIDVRWRLLESYALARQEGLAEPIGLVVDTACPYARTIGQHLLIVPELTPFGSKLVTCMERALLESAIRVLAPEVAATLSAYTDQPGCWTAVLLDDQASVFAGTWQELISAPMPQKTRVGRSRSI
jgi:hypothetical protein